MSILDKFPDFDDSELKSLTQIIAQLLCSGDAALEETLAMPNAHLAREACNELARSGVTISHASLEKVLQKPEQSRELCLAILSAIKQVPEFVDDVNRAYETSKEEMDAGVVLLAGAVLVLALKVEHVSLVRRTGPSESQTSVTIRFRDLRKTVVNAVTKLLAGLAGG